MFSFYNEFLIIVTNHFSLEYQIPLYQGLVYDYLQLILAPALQSQKNS